MEILGGGALTESHHHREVSGIPSGHALLVGGLGGLAGCVSARIAVSCGRVT